MIRDKRKIDASGRPRTSSGDEHSAGGATAAASSESPAEANANMGQPVQPEAAARGDDIVDAEEVVAGELITPTAENVEAGLPPAFGAELESLRSELDERLRDLQRVTAEYANYRKRVDRDRAAVVEQAVGMVISALLPILDDFDRAREHDDLVGPLGAVAEQLSAALAKFGLTGFGESGDAFDPTRHEAVAHQTSADVTEPTCVSVMRRGYLLGDRLLRAALVGVADPE